MSNWAEVQTIDSTVNRITQCKEENKENQPHLECSTLKLERSETIRTTRNGKWVITRGNKEWNEMQEE
jgi:hypothetical protein